MARAWRQYLILVPLLACAIVYQTGNITYLVHAILHADQVPAKPFSIATASRTILDGPIRGDEILAIGGRPFNAWKQYVQAVDGGRPGDNLRLTLSEPSGQAIEREVQIGSQAPNYDSAAKIVLSLSLDLFIPLLTLLLGFGVAFIRPRDWNAWLLLSLLLGFSVLSGRAEWHSDYPGFKLAWDAVWNGAWAIAMLLFGIYFPKRLPLDQRLPWLKYLLLVPTVAVELAYWGTALIWVHDIDAVARFYPEFRKVSLAFTILQTISVGGFFVCLGYKARKEKSPDDRRRLMILRIGTSISLTPVFLIVVRSLFVGGGLFDGVSWPLQVFALLLMALFPLTLAYVIIVERAMDLNFAIRQSVKYGLARGGLWLLRATLVVLAIYVFSTHAGKSWRSILVVAAVVSLVVIRRRNTEKASAWLDRKFFREAYDAETMLSELAVEVGRYVEIDPLLQTVARRISNTMHVPDIVILVREGSVYKTRYSTRPGQPMDIAASSRILMARGEQNVALQVYLDKPQPWIRSLSTEELQALSFMRSELLLVLQGRGSEEGQVIGIMSLGSKKSQEPYSKTDVRLLQTIAVQMGMALQNSRLAASLADEAAHREVMNRELEIAREVQERLFPQKFPKVAGVDCFGHCRPARGVGGDYYDFIELADGRLGIAIGDVSGKGVSAALLMASLQASLRGQTMAGVHDLAELMRNVNKLIFDTSQSNRYATFFYGEFDPANRQFAYVNAGHNAPVILRGDEVIRLKASGPVVGLLPRVDYTMDACQLQHGDIFVGYTDGISEAMNESDEEWEEDRFIASARAFASDSAKDIIGAIFRKADAFTGAAQQYDDMTLSVMKLTG